MNPFNYNFLSFKSLADNSRHADNHFLQHRHPKDSSMHITAGLWRKSFALWLALLWLMGCGIALAAGEPPTLRIGVLKFGTVNWGLDVIQQHGLDKAEGVNLQIVPLASKSATHVAIQGGAVDVIVTDWLWVSRQRSEGRDYTFVPASRLVGALMVHPDAGIKSLADLRGKRIGVAGGPIDKSWLLLRAYSRKQLGEDLADIAQPSFAAPPLLNELTLRGDLPAALNFWHYSARLAAAGLVPLVKIEDVIADFGIHRPLPLIGWVFRESWANQHRELLTAFLRASRAATQIMADSDSEWERLRPLTNAEDDATLHHLRDAYRQGIATCFGAPEREAVAKVFDILAQEGGEALVGKQTELSQGTFWQASGLTACP
jgi:NitT/TauT family transport system substrate-binding protein